MTLSSFHKPAKGAKRTRKTESDRWAAPPALNQGSDRTYFQPPAFRGISGRQTLLCCLGLTAIVLAAYIPVAHNGWVLYDDNTYITENAHVKAGLTWDSVKWAFTTYDSSNWHPLTWLSHELDITLFGFTPQGAHGMNVLLHAINAALLFLFLQYATGFRRRSLMVAALFALHPINVESVAWAAERKNVLSMLFFLLTLMTYVWYTRAPSRKRYAVVAGLFALALLAKPQVITLPFLLLLLDCWPLERTSVLGSWISFPGNTASSGKLAKGKQAGRAALLPFSSLLLEKVPLLFLSAASALITLKAQGLAIQEGSPYSVGLRLETSVMSYVRYLGKAIWPSKLVAMYPHPTQLYPVWQVAAAAILLFAVTAVVLRARERQHRQYLAVGWFWYLGSLVPMIGLVQVGDQALADRYAYIPFIGLFVMTVWLIADWARERQYAARWLVLPAAGYLLVLAILTFRQVDYWHDTESFWRRTLALTQNNFVAEDSMGRALRSEGKYEEAVLHYRAALAIRPDDLPAMLNLGAYEHSHGNLTSAIEHYQFVAQHAANVTLRAKADANLGSAYRQLGEKTKAKEFFEKSIELAPQPSIMVALGVMAQTDGDLNEAIRQYSNAARLHATDVELLLLGNALLEQGLADQGNAMIERARRISRNFGEAQKQVQALLTAH
jgi:tetratricopeptide (TPR) repeat protein